MRSFRVVWDHAAALDVLEARAFLGVVRAATLDAELEKITERLSALPESAPPAYLRGRWSKTIRRLSLSRSPFYLFYIPDLAAEEVLMLALKHKSARPPKLL